MSNVEDPQQTPSLVVVTDGSSPQGESAESESVESVEHAMKRIEASQGRFFWTESRFVVDAPDVPSGLAPSPEVEREVELYIDRVRALDRARRLSEL